MPHEDAAAAADVEEPVTGAERERLEDGRPREGVAVGRPIGLARGSAVRTAGDPVRHPVDPPLADQPGKAQTAF